MFCSLPSVLTDSHDNPHNNNPNNDINKFIVQNDFFPPENSNKKKFQYISFCVHFLITILLAQNNFLFSRFWLRFDSVRYLSKWIRRRRQTCTYYEKWQCDGIDKRHILIIFPYTQVPENAHRMPHTPCFWGHIYMLIFWNILYSFFSVLV